MTAVLDSKKRSRNNIKGEWRINTLLKVKKFAHVNHRAKSKQNPKQKLMSKQMQESNNYNYDQEKRHCTRAD